LLAQLSGRQLVSLQANWQVLLARVDPASQLEQTLVAEQRMQPVMLQGVQVLVAEAKVKPSTHPEQTLLVEQALQLGLEQITQEPLLALKPS
jgi:hypothetical protein